MCCSCFFHYLYPVSTSTLFYHFIYSFFCYFSPSWLVFDFVYYIYLSISLYPPMYNYLCIYLNSIYPSVSMSISISIHSPIYLYLSTCKWGLSGIDGLLSVPVHGDWLTYTYLAMLESLYLYITCVLTVAVSIFPEAY